MNKYGRRQCIKCGKLYLRPYKYSNSFCSVLCHIEYLRDDYDKLYEEVYRKNTKADQVSIEKYEQEIKLLTERNERSLIFLARQHTQEIKDLKSEYEQKIKSSTQRIAQLISILKHHNILVPPPPPPPRPHYP